MLKGVRPFPTKGGGVRGNRRFPGKGRGLRGNLGFPKRRRKIPNPNLYILFSISYPVPTVFPDLSSLEYMVNTESGPIKHIIDIMYMYN